MVFVGTGVSLASCSPPQRKHASWDGLLNTLLDEARLEQRTQEGSNADAKIELVRMLEENKGKDWVRRRAAELTSTLTISSLDVIKWIVRLRAPIVTTNYDTLLEQGIENLCRTTCASVCWSKDDVTSLFEAIRRPRSSVIHMHGICTNPDSIIFGQSDYDELCDDLAVQAAMRAILTLRTVLFVGFGAGISDPHFVQLRNWMAKALTRPRIRHYQLTISREVRSELVPGDPIVRISYGDEYEHLGPFVRSLEPLAIVPLARVHTVIVPGVLGPERCGAAFREQIEVTPLETNEPSSAQFWDWTYFADEMAVRAQDRINNQLLLNRCGAELAASLRSFSQIRKNYRLNIITCSGGARIMLSAARILAQENCGPVVDCVILLSPACDAYEDLSPLESISCRRFCYFSGEDQVLRLITRWKLKTLWIAGMHGFRGNGRHTIEQLSWRKSFSQPPLDCFSDHLGCLEPTFAGKYVIPLLRENIEEWEDCECT